MEYADGFRVRLETFHWLEKRILDSHVRLCDFKALNDKEFEILCADLLGEVEGRRFERFKGGKDAGVDGRFFNDAGKEVILQCKHWSNTPLNQLLRTLSSSHPET